MPPKALKTCTCSQQTRRVPPLETFNDCWHCRCDAVPERIHTRQERRRLNNPDVLIRGCARMTYCEDLSSIVRLALGRTSRNGGSTWVSWLLDLTSNKSASSWMSKSYGILILIPNPKLTSSGCSHGKYPWTRVREGKIITLHRARARFKMARHLSRCIHVSGTKLIPVYY